MQNLFKLIDAFYKNAQVRRRIVYDRSGLKPSAPRATEPTRQTRTRHPIEQVDVGGEYQAPTFEDVPEYTEEELENFYIPEDMFGAPKSRYETTTSVTPEWIETEQTRARERREWIQQQKAEEQEAYSRMMEQARQQAAKLEEERPRTRGLSIREKGLSAYSPDEIARLKEELEERKSGKKSNPEKIDKDIRREMKETPWAFVVDKEGNPVRKSPEEIAQIKKEIEEQRKEKLLKLRKQKPQEIRLAKIIIEQITDTEKMLERLGVEISTKKPTPKTYKTKDERVWYRAPADMKKRREIGYRTVNPEETRRYWEGEQQKDPYEHEGWTWVQTTIQAPSKKGMRSKNIYVKVRSGFEDPNRRKAYTESIIDKVKELYNMKNKLMELKRELSL